MWTHKVALFAGCKKQMRKPLFQFWHPARKRHKYGFFRKESISLRNRICHRGKSTFYLLPATIFGLVEKWIKKQNIIIDRQGYELSIGKYSRVLRRNGNLKIFDWESVASTVFKNPEQYHFRFNQSKRFKIAKTYTSNNIYFPCELF